ncbi:MAG: RND family transporter [Candidatus Methanomethylophilaceae archaeon]
MFTSKRAWWCIALVLVLSLASVASIVVMGVTQTFSVSQFEPDSDVVRSLEQSSAEFESRHAATVLVEFLENETTHENLNKSQFLQVLEMERAIFMDESINPHLRDPMDWRNCIYSPVSLISLVMLNIITSPNSTLPIDWSGWGLEMVPAIDAGTGLPVLDPETGEPVLVAAPSYDNLILMIENLFTVHIHQAIFLMMEDGSNLDEASKDALRSLLSQDFCYDSFTNVSASAGLVIVYYHADNISLLQMEREILQKTEAMDPVSLRFHVVGWGLVNQQISDSSTQNLLVLFPLAALVILSFLYWFLRDIGDVLVTMASLLMAILWVYGYAALVGEVLTPLSLAVPFLVIGVGTDFSIHLILRYRQEREEGRSRQESSRIMMLIVGQALVLSTITTCVAYLSNISSDMSGMIQFGVMNALGLLSAFVIIMLLVPSYLSLRNDAGPHSRRRKGVNLDRFMDGVTTLVQRRGRSVAAVLAVGTLCMGIAAVNVEVDFDPYQFLPQGTAISTGVQMLSENFPGSGLNELTVLVQGEANDTELLLLVQKALSDMASVDNVIKHGGQASTASIFDVWHDWAIYSGPGDQRFNASFQSLYSQHFLFNDSASVFINATTPELQAMIMALEGTGLGADDMSRYFSDEDGGVLRITIAIYDALLESEMRALEADLYAVLSPLSDAGFGHIVTGDALVSYEVVDVMRRAQMLSVAITLGSALAILSVIGLLMRRSLLLGVITVLPTTVTIVWIWGISYLMGVTLNPLTMTVAAITVGVGVDYSIHMVNRYFDLLQEGVDCEEAIHDTVGHSGKGVLGGAVTTAIGFGVLSLFNMPPISEFGIMVTLSILLSLFMTLFLLPSILVVWGPRLSGR